jgi:hypothetical protein
LAGGARPALIATILGHLLRCLYYRDGRCQGRGRCKASWIAATFGVAPRRVKQARGELIALGWLIPLDADQWALNRWGAHLRINLAWEWPAGVASSLCPATPAASLPEASLPVEVGPGPELAPPPANPGPELAPPYPDRQPLQELKHQEPTSGGPTGVCIHGSSQEKTSPESPPGPPTLRHVVKEDLQDMGRLIELHHQAIAEGLVTPSERDRLRFVAAAEHARVIGTQNPCGLFVHLVRGRLYHFLTQDDEDAANVRIKRHLYGAPREGGGGEPRPVFADRPKLSEDAVLVQAVQAALARVGYRGDPFCALRSQKPEWTRERWDRAVAEIEQAQFGQTSRGKSE